MTKLTDSDGGAYFTYNAFRELTQIEHPDGSTLQLTLSQLSMIDQQGQTGGNAVAPKSIYLGHDAIGDVTTIYRANSVNIGPNSQFDPADTALSYNALGLLTGISQTHAGASLENLSYTYDPLARVSTFASIDGTATYGYDPTSQLTSATYTTAPGGTEPPNLSVSFDPNGNRTSVNGTTTTVGTDNHLTSDGTFNFTYDPAGNVSTRIRISNVSANDYKTLYDWDYRNRLTDVEFYNNSGVLTQHVHYAYDVWDHLIERDLDPTGGGTYTQIVHYVWDGNNVVLAFNGSQQLTARYLNGPNTSAYDQYFTTLAEEDVSSVTSPGTVTYDLLDPQGSVDDIVDANGNKVDHIVYDPFGQTVLETSTSVSHLGGWQGGYTDPVTGMEKFGARWYILADAVWASQDPLGFGGGDTNLSRAVFNDPTNLSDPSGLYTPSAGHHLVPQSIFGGSSGFGKGVVDVFNEATVDLLYSHGNDTWGGLTHPDYIKAVRAELERAMGGVGNAANFSPAQARAFVAAILSGECPGGGSAKNWETIRKYLHGMANSNIVAAAAANAADGKVTNKADLKKLARLADATGSNGKLLASDLTSPEAIAFYEKWIKSGLFRKMAIRGALKAIPPVLLLIAANKCSKAYASDGIAGAARAAADEAFMADAIEELAATALAPAGKYFDNQLDTGQMNHLQRRLRNSAIDPRDRENMRRALQGPRGYLLPQKPFE